jgi:hypothetical protein
MTTMDVHYRLATPDDFGRIDELKRRHKWVTRTDEQWRWEYIEKPGHGSLLLMVEENGNLVGTQALLPIKFRKGRDTFLTAKSEETFLVPNLRGKGILGLMYKEIFSYVDFNQIEATWGITGARKALSAAGFDIPYDIVRYRVSLQSAKDKQGPWPIRLASISKNVIRSDFSFLSPKSMSYERGSVLTGVDDVLDLEFISDIWKAVTRKFPEVASIDRSLPYLEWRLLRNPWVKHNMIRYARSSSDRGYLVYSINQKGGCKVVDAMAVGQSKEVFHTMYEVMIHRAREMGCQEIVDFFLRNSCILDIQRFAAMQSMLFIQRPLYSAFVYRRNPCIEKNSPHLDVGSWYFTGLFLEGTS